MTSLYRMKAGAALFALLFVLAFAISPASAWFFSSNKNKGLKPPFPMPELTMKSAMDDSTVSLASYKGSVLLVNYWATWCPPCVAEMPDLNRLHNELSGKGFAVVGFSMDSGSSKSVKKLAETLGISYPVVMGGDKVSKEFGEIIGIPVTFLVDRQGTVVKRYDGPRDYEDFLHDIKEVMNQ